MTDETLIPKLSKMIPVDAPTTAELYVLTGRKAPTPEVEARLARREEALKQIEERLKEREALVLEFLKDDPIYLQLDQGGKKHVKEGIQEALRKRDQPGDTGSHHWYLKSQVQPFLESMLDGQRANEAMAADREAARKAGRGPLEHATREPENNNLKR